MPEAVPATIPKVAVGPTTPRFATVAVEAAGGKVVEVGDDADALVWLGPADVGGARSALERTPGIRWIQLPWAGVEPFATAGLLTDGRTWTCAKGSYAEPVAEHALALALAGLRYLPERLAARSWGEAKGVSLYDSKVAILGGGGIALSLLRLLEPFRVEATVMRRHGADRVEGAAHTVGPEALDQILSGKQVVFLALSFVPDTRGIIDAAALTRMDETAWLVNVARGGHVVTDDLVVALREGQIAGAALDVTDPEPLPDGHPLWDLPNAIITPHSADWAEIVNQMLANRIERNVRNFATDRPLEGVVDPVLGY